MPLTRVNWFNWQHKLRWLGNLAASLVTFLFNIHIQCYQDDRRLIICLWLSDNTKERETALVDDLGRVSMQNKSTEEKPKGEKKKMHTPEQTPPFFGRFSSGRWYCECENMSRMARCLTVKKGDNKGLKFWACPCPQSEQCPFYLWVGNEEKAKAWLSRHGHQPDPETPRKGKSTAAQDPRTPRSGASKTNLETPFTKAKRKPVAALRDEGREVLRDGHTVDVEVRGNFNLERDAETESSESEVEGEGGRDDSGNEEVVAGPSRKAAKMTKFSTPHREGKASEGERGMGHPAAASLPTPTTDKSKGAGASSTHRLQGSESPTPLPKTLPRKTAQAHDKSNTISNQNPVLETTSKPAEAEAAPPPALLAPPPLIFPPSAYQTKPSPNSNPIFTPLPFTTTPLSASILHLLLRSQNTPSKSTTKPTSTSTSATTSATTSPTHSLSTALQMQIAHEIDVEVDKAQAEVRRQRETIRALSARVEELEGVVGLLTGGVGVGVGEGEGEGGEEGWEGWD